MKFLAFATLLILSVFGTRTFATSSEVGTQQQALKSNIISPSEANEYMVAYHPVWRYISRRSGRF